MAQHPPPGPDINDPTRFLSPVTERLLQRAATILAAPPTTHTHTISPHLHGAISALLASSYGYDAEHLIEPDVITWAHTHGGALHIIEHPDGSVTFTNTTARNADTAAAVDLSCCPRCRRRTRPNVLRGAAHTWHPGETCQLCRINGSTGAGTNRRATTSILIQILPTGAQWLYQADPSDSE